MVRLKSRYIFFEILTPFDEESGSQDRSFTSKKDILLRHRRTSPTTVNPKSILQELRKVIQTNFGDYGLGKATTLLQIKYFSNRTSSGIIRCGHGDHQYILMAFAFINKINGFENIIVNPVKVSGTIKKIEQFAIRRNHQMNSIISNREDEDILAIVADDEVS